MAKRYVVEFKSNKTTIGKLYLETDIKNVKYISIELKRDIRAHVSRNEAISYSITTSNSLKDLIKTLPFMESKVKEDIEVLDSGFTGFIDKLDKSLLSEDYEKIINKYI